MIKSSRLIKVGKPSKECHLCDESDWPFKQGLVMLKFYRIQQWIDIRVIGESGFALGPWIYCMGWLLNGRGTYEEQIYFPHLEW